MDIVYDSQTKRILNYYNTSGEVNRNGSVKRVTVFRDMAKFIPQERTVVWSWITAEEQVRIPAHFYSNFRNYFIVEDENLHTPVAIRLNNIIYPVKQAVRADHDLPIIWHGLFYDSVSYSLINRKMAFSLADRGYNLQVFPIKRSPDRNELSKEDLEKLIELGANKPNLAERDCIRLHCYLPTDRTPPAKFNIAYTMMESHGVRPFYISALNSDYNESWFPCFVEGTNILLKNDIEKIENVKVAKRAYTKQGNYNRVMVTSVKPYSGELVSVDTALMDQNLLGTADHPTFCVSFSSSGEIIRDGIKPLKELTQQDWLMYPREKINYSLEEFSLSDMLKKNLGRSKTVETYRDKIVITCKDYVYNHMLEELTKYPFLMSGSNIINDKMIVNDEFIQLLAMVFEISFDQTKKGTFVFTFKKSESEMAQQMSQLITNCFGILNKVKPFKSQYLVFVYSEVFIEIMSCLLMALDEKAKFDIFGQLNERQLKLFLDTLFSTQSKTAKGKVKYLGSKYRINYLTRILLNLGIFPTISRTEVDNMNQLELSWDQSSLLVKENPENSRSAHHVATDEYVYFKVIGKKTLSVKDFPVYNLEVKKDNTYIANFVSVHNCNFNIKGFVDAGLQKPTQHMPLAIDHKKFVPGLERVEDVNFHILNPKPDRFPARPQGFKFLAIFRYSYRKGPDLLIKAFRKAFKATDDVSLIIFSRSYLGNVENDSINTTEATLADLSKWVAEDENSAPIYWCRDYLPDELMPNLYGWADCFVSTSRGEGFGLPPIEAAACKIPVIAPNHSAMGDYMNNENGYVIELDGLQSCGMMVKDGNKLKYQGPDPNWAGWITPGYVNQEFPIWGESAVKQTAELMQSVIENPAEAQRRAEIFYQFVLDNYTWEKAIDRIGNRLNEIKKKI